MSNPTQTLWGSVNADGTVAAGSSGGFTVTATQPGQYVISFQHLFNGIPAIVGSQTRYGSLNESPLDNVAFPQLNNGSAVAVTGDSQGNKGNRNFSFIAIGQQGAENPEFKASK